MNKKLPIILCSITILNTYSMDNEPAQLQLMARSKTVPLKLPSDEEAFAQAKQLNDDMQLLTAWKKKPTIERALTPETLQLLRLDPNLGHNVKDNIKKLNCQATILEGTQLFDESQEAFLQLEATAPHTIAADTGRYDDLTAIEDRQLEALCIFVNSYNKGCFEAYPLIASVHRSVMNLENKRKFLNKDCGGIHPKYIEKEFLKEIKKINIMEEQHKKDIRKSLSLAPNQLPVVSSKSNVDLNNSGELRTQAMSTLQIADSYTKRVINTPNTDITRIEYQHAEILYCMGIQTAIASFHIQPDTEEKKVLFEDIQINLRKVQELQKLQREKKIDLEISQEYAAICKFFENHRHEYEVPDNQKGKVTWNRSIRETRDTPPPSAERGPRTEPIAPSKSRLQKFLECISPCSNT